jgi:hypothetical protein
MDSQEQVEPNLEKLFSILQLMAWHKMGVKLLLKPVLIRNRNSQEVTKRAQSQVCRTWAKGNYNKMIYCTIAKFKLKNLRKLNLNITGPVLSLITQTQDSICKGGLLR